MNDSQVDDELQFELNEFITLTPTILNEETSQEVNTENNSESTESGNNWSEGVTRRLLHLYKTNYKKVGHSIPTFKKLYEILCQILNSEYSINVKPLQVENKMRNLIKAYKNIVDNDRKTGRGKKFFKFEMEMADIFSSSKKIHPDVLLSEKREIIIKPLQSKIKIAKPSIPTFVEQQSEVIEPHPIKKPGAPDPAKKRKIFTHDNGSSSNLDSPSPPSSYRNRDTRTSVLTRICEDRAKFYKEQLQIIRKDAEERAEIRKLLAERNELMREYLARIKPSD